MIVIDRYNGGISVKGHANYAEPGKDIVCAGVSVLVQTLIASLEQITSAKIKYSISPGTVDIKYESLTGSAHALINSFFIGVEMIADEYPDNVSMSKH